ncbi:glycosyl hydrolase family 65 protein [Xylocopilactobacillus apicola]|uniref:Maltose phosphorylase n=1 Tax=Xylocopilactobacillus apicola TaxID=2932184 RepID=A0AAU9D439_9LACO|nr:glycosyl hydrolase family 65 protein [Xylocopilactobacillus apicola]BDR59616.1 maltose phosphorylase [Xylocopilactobacillus apicola]
MSNLFEVDPWHLITNKWDETGDYQKALTLTNSVMELDGSFEEQPTFVKLQNIWNSRAADTACGYEGYQPGFLDLKKIEIYLNDQPINWQEDEISDFIIDLDLHQGLLTRSFVVTRSNLKVRLQFERFLSVAMPDLLTERVKLENLGSRPSEVEIHASLDSYQNEATVDPEWEILSTTTERSMGSMLMIMRANQFGTPRFMAGAEAHHLTSLRAVVNPEYSNYRAENWFRGTLQPAESTFFEKRVVVATSLKYSSDHEISAQLAARSNEMDNFAFEDLLAINADAWAKKYEKTDLVITGNDQLQQIVRADNYRFLANLAVLTPQSWLNDAFVVPALLETGQSDAALELLNLRAKQLPLMMENAKLTGSVGAFLPEVTFDGHENSSEQALFSVHRSAALVFAIAQYVNFTDDQAWLQSTGKELLVAIANFWHYRAQYAENRQKYVILSVTGPDEYEFNVNNNWLTNYMLQWDLNYILATIPEEFDEELTAELQDLAAKIELPESDKIKLQDDGFSQKDLNLTAEKLTIFDQPVEEKWTLDRLGRAPIAEQPDVFWAFYYAPQGFKTAEIKENYNFYQKYLVHATEISRNLTAMTAALAGELGQSIELLQANNEHFEAITMSKAASTRLAITHGLLGLAVKDGMLALEPQLPEELLSYQVPVVFQGRTLEIRVESNSCTISIKEGANLTILFNGKEESLSDGALAEFPLK